MVLLRNRSLVSYTRWCMKILTNEPENPLQGLANLENPSSAQTPTADRADIFQNLILSASSDPEQRLNKPETPKVLDFIKSIDIKSDAHKLEDVTDLDASNQLIAQLDMINQQVMVANPLPQPVKTDEATIKTDQPTTDVTPKATAKLNQPVDVALTANTTDSASVETKVVQASSAQGANNLSTMNNIPKSDVLDKNISDDVSKLISNLSKTVNQVDSAPDEAPATNPVNTLNEKLPTPMPIQAKSDLSNMAKNIDPKKSYNTSSDQKMGLSQKSYLNKDMMFATAEDQVQHLVNTAMTDIVPLPHQNQYDMQQNKYTEALAQLGSYINAQTSQYSGKIYQNNAAPVNTSTDAQAAGFSPTYHPDYDLNIELARLSPDALGHEAYNAKIKIYPPELGHVLAKLKVDKNNAELVIMAENSHVKQIIEANLTQLRENFQKSDINLTTVQVNVQNSQTDSSLANDQNKGSDESKMVTERTDDQEKKQLSTEKKSNSLVDTYV